MASEVISDGDQNSPQPIPSIYSHGSNNQKVWVLEKEDSFSNANTKVSDGTSVTFNFIITSAPSHVAVLILHPSLAYSLPPRNAEVQNLSNSHYLYTNLSYFYQRNSCPTANLSASTVYYCP